MREITEFDWNRYVLAEQAKRPGRKMFDDRKYMRQVMLYAYREGFTPRQVRLAIPDTPSDIGREITPDEIRRLQLVATRDLHFQIDIAVKTGLRLREMLRLRWDQVDWNRRIIRLGSGDTKTRRSREVPLTPDVFLSLETRHRQAKSRFVFPRPRDNSKPQGNNKTAWRRAKRLAKIKCRWHDFRHTAASRMLRRGVKMYVAKAILGMSERVLTEIYAHVNEDDLRAAAKAMAG